MKELWLFGKLDTLGEDERDVQRREKLEEDVKAIQEALAGGLLTPSFDEAENPQKSEDTEKEVPEKLRGPEQSEKLDESEK